VVSFLGLLEFAMDLLAALFVAQGLRAAVGHLWLVLVILRQGQGEAPDSGETILRSRGRPKLPATAGRARLREEPSPADIVYSKRYSLSELDVSGQDEIFLAREDEAEGYSGFCYAG
jgi:hypothetical protein